MSTDQKSWMSPDCLKLHPDEVSDFGSGVYICRICYAKHDMAQSLKQTMASMREALVFVEAQHLKEFLGVTPQEQEDKGGRSFWLNGMEL